MPFASEQDRFIVMAHFRSGTLKPDGNWSYSLQSCIEQFMQQYPDEMIDIFKQHKCRLVHRFETKNCICKGKLTAGPTVLTENVIENIQERINRSPKKAVSQLSPQTGLSDFQRTAEWQKKCENSNVVLMDISELSNKLICEKHFIPTDININNKRKLLNKTAVPVKYVEPIISVQGTIKTYGRKRKTHVKENTENSSEEDEETLDILVHSSEAAVTTKRCPERVNRLQRESPSNQAG
ncbi:hypothetical protein FQA39_LY10196 [Lamprigera yunnana]|nr:hypothetical protein FQA39_LY10196 [Lamprigera yunnana]